MQARYIMRLPEVLQKTGFGRSSLYGLIKDGKFPAPRPIGKRAVGFDSQQVQAWIDAKLESTQ